MVALGGVLFLMSEVPLSVFSCLWGNTTMQLVALGCLALLLFFFFITLKPRVE